MAFRANQRLLRFSLEYFTLLLLLAGGLVYHNGSAFRDGCIRVDGDVIGQIGGGDLAKARPVFHYVIDGDEYQAVPPNAAYPIGVKAPLLVVRGHPQEIYVYDGSYWVSFAFDTFPIFLFGGIGYALLMVQSYRLRRQMIVLAAAEARLAGFQE
ncbi:hypothetical protein [Flaviaesturariibacter terrae]